MKAILSCLARMILMKKILKKILIQERIKDVQYTSLAWSKR